MTSPFTINVSFDSSVSAAPAAFESAVESAVQYLETEFVNPVTINITIGYGEVGGNSLEAGAVGERASPISSKAVIHKYLRY